MGDFIRARSAEQKEQRLAEVKAVARELFAELPYHQITLSIIAERLGWSRANLYKYVSTKEEIFLEISADERDAYLDALLAAFPEGCGYSVETAAEVWAGIVAGHRGWFAISDLLFTIIETNVSVERLMEFKRGWYERLGALAPRLAGELGVAEADVEALVNTVHYHAVGVVGNCANNPLVAEALARLGIEPTVPELREEMRGFILMCLERYRGVARGGKATSPLPTSGC